MALPLKIGLEATINGSKYTITQKNTYNGFLQKKKRSNTANEDGEYEEKYKGETGTFDVWILENTEDKLELWQIYQECWLVKEEKEIVWLNDKISYSKNALQFQDSGQVIINLDELFYHVENTAAIGSASLEITENNKNQSENQSENQEKNEKNIRFTQIINKNFNYIFVVNNQDYDNIIPFEVKKLRIENVLEFFKNAGEIAPIQQTLSRLKTARYFNLIFILIGFLGWFLGIILDKKEVFSYTFDATNIKDTTLSYTSKDFYLPKGNYLFEMIKQPNVVSNNENQYIKMPYEIGVDSYTELYLYEDEPPLYEFVGSAWQSMELDEGQYYSDGSYTTSEYISMPKSDTLFVDIHLREENNSQNYELKSVYVNFSIKEAGFIWYNYLWIMFIFSVIGLIIEGIILNYRQF